MRYGSILFALIILACGFIPRAHADPPEAMLRDATGYPDSSHTDGRLPMPGNSSGGGEGVYHISSLVLDLAEPTVITRFAGVGFDLQSHGFDWDATVWKLNVWQATAEFTARELFEQSPKNGNVINNRVLTETHAEYGAGDYYLTWTPTDAVTFPAGSYLLSIRGHATGSGGTWNFHETSIDLGSDYHADSNFPGQSFIFTDDLGYPTGSEALDIWGYEITCPGDLDFDDDIDLADFAMLQVGFGTTSGASYEDGDLDLDGDVDLDDATQLIDGMEAGCP